MYICFHYKLVKSDITQGQEWKWKYVTTILKSLLVSYILLESASLSFFKLIILLYVR